MIQRSSQHDYSGLKKKTNAKIEVFLLASSARKKIFWDVLVDPARK